MQSRYVFMDSTASYASAPRCLLVRCLPFPGRPRPVPDVERPPHDRPRLRRRRPQQPGMRKASSVNRPERNARSTSSTGPQVCGRTRTPAESSAASSGRETAPQISTCTPNPTIRSALAARGASSRSTSLRPASAFRPTFTRRRCLATSSTGETRPSHVGIPSFISKHVRKTCAISDGRPAANANTHHSNTLR